MKNFRVVSILLTSLVPFLTNCGSQLPSLSPVEFHIFDKALKCVVLHPIEKDPLQLDLVNLKIISRLSQRILTNGWISQKEVLELRPLSNGVSTVRISWKDKTISRDFFGPTNSAAENTAELPSESKSWLASAVAWFLPKEKPEPSLSATTKIETNEVTQKEIIPVLDIELYNKKLEQLANNPSKETTAPEETSSGSTSITEKTKWPVKGAYPKYGALLPFHRIVAYYGNFYSKKMGVLGEYPEDEMLEKLSGEVKKWEMADPSTPVIPAIHYIAATAQAAPGHDKKYMLQMPFSEIDKSLELAKKVNGIVFLDLQIGNSELLEEVTTLKKYLELPQVHLGIDPEFAMKPGEAPGTRIGTIDASDINEVAKLLAKIVHDNELPPKILVIHRFTTAMVTRAQAIKPLSEVQIVMHMDGFGDANLKKATYRAIITEEPVQFAGIKLFYKNDVAAPGSQLMTPNDLLKLSPIPSYVQYQ